MLEDILGINEVNAPDWKPVIRCVPDQKDVPVYLQAHAAAAERAIKTFPLNPVEQYVANRGFHRSSDAICSRNVDYGGGRRFEHGLIEIDATHILFQ